MGWLSIGLLLVSCQTFDRVVETQRARFELSSCLDQMVVEGSAFDLTIQLIQVVQRQSRASDFERVVSAMNQSLGHSEQLTVMASLKYLGELREQVRGPSGLVGEQTVQFDRLDQADMIQILAPTKIYTLKESAPNEFKISIANRPNNKGDDLLRMRAQAYERLAPGKFARVISDMQKNYPSFVWR